MCEHIGKGQSKNLATRSGSGDNSRKTNVQEGRVTSEVNARSESEIELEGLRNLKTGLKQIKHGQINTVESTRHSKGVDRRVWANVQYVSQP